MANTWNTQPKADFSKAKKKKKIGLKSKRYGGKNCKRHESVLFLQQQTEGERKRERGRQRERQTERERDRKREKERESAPSEVKIGIGTDRPNVERTNTMNELFPSEMQ